MAPPAVKAKQHSAVAVFSFLNGDLFIILLLGIILHFSHSTAV
jgi:hypothetical protein